MAVPEAVALRGGLQFLKVQGACLETVLSALFVDVSREVIRDERGCLWEPVADAVHSLLLQKLLQCWSEVTTQQPEFRIENVLAREQEAFGGEVKGRFSMGVQATTYW